MHLDAASLRVRPLQPWFVINAAEDYLKRSVSQSPIAHFYSFTVNQAEPMTLAVPDGSVDLLLHCCPEAPSGRVCGSTASAKITRLMPGERYFGVRFMPGIMPAFLDLSPGELAGQELPFDEVAPDTPRLLRRLVNSHDFNDQINVFLHYFSYWTNRSAPPLLLQIIDLIMANEGKIRVDELERKTLYSARYIHRLFQDNCGMSPKTFCRTIRFQRALTLLNQGYIDNLTTLAQHLDYADQSHFFREFKAFTSCSPQRYLARLQAVRYQRRIRQC
ncbi:helix-turn-helix domain-containing protein [Pectobacterium cacticida]|uniref:helix-turn-helix domain-containing protein n=1 Tax=Pectobacterium cacticida TaxID=69221 RepID=UPI003987E31B